jgi:hypothetical protein
VVLALVALAACSSPATVVLPPLEIVVASGDTQYGTTGQTLGLPLRVVVRTLSGKVPTSGVEVAWAVSAGDASIEGIGRTMTDSTGSAEVFVRLGAVTGAVVVQASAETQNRPSATFDLFVVDPPEITGIQPASAAPGEPVTLSGANFIPVADQNVVLFSGLRGRVIGVSAGSITVEVPRCLPARPVSVRMQLGVVGSGTLPFTVEEGGEIRTLAVGEAVDIVEEGGYTCLPLAGSAQYLALVQSTSIVGAATHPFTMAGLSSSVPTAATHFEQRWPLPFERTRILDAQSHWDRTLRELESGLFDGPGTGDPTTAPATRAAPARVPPAVGTRRTFNVYRGDGDFASVSAVARHVGSQVALFVDEAAPAGGFTPADLEAFAARFDDVIHPVVTGAYGATSDLDDNQRIIVLFTPVVNALTPRGTSGFVGGFFYGIDLLPERQGSNAGEVFYSIVPDPDGIHSTARSKQTVLDVTPAILAHEFQHMVHFNERMLQLQASATEAVWLSEGLAQMAEELVARAYAGAGDAPSAEIFRAGARLRARRYLAGTDTVALIISTGQGSLAERGAGFLFAMYLQDRFGADVAGRLSRTTSTGVANVEAVTGRPWAELLADWWSAVLLDGTSTGSGAMRYPTVDLRTFLGNPFPLAPVALGAGDFTRSGSLWSSSAGYYIVVPPVGGMTALRLGGEAGGVSSRFAELRLRIVRIS